MWGGGIATSLQRLLKVSRGICNALTVLTLFCIAAFANQKKNNKYAVPWLPQLMSLGLGMGVFYAIHVACRVPEIIGLVLKYFFSKNITSNSTVENISAYIAHVHIENPKVAPTNPHEYSIAWWRWYKTFLNNNI